MSAPGAAIWTNATDLVYYDRGHHPISLTLGETVQRLTPYIDLLEKWQSTFQSLHLIRNGSESVSESESRSSVVHASMEYIAQLAAYRDQAEDSVVQSRIRLCESMMMLVHAVFILPHQSVSRQLVKWVIFHNAPLHGQVSGSIWRSIHKCILGGYISQAIHLIKQHHNPSSQHISPLISLLESIPLLDPNNTCLTCSQFDQVFDLYRIRCDQFVSSLGSEHQSDLLAIGKILQGDVSVILDSARDICPDNWLYVLSALLIFSNPTATKSDLSDIVAICVQSQQRKIAYQDSIHQILSGDVSCSLVALYTQLRISWLSAHLADLLHLCGYNLSNMIGNQSLRIRLIFEYGNELSSDVDLWHIAPSYLLTCGSSGLQLLRSSILGHVHDEFTAEKALDLCQRLQLSDDVISICKQMASRSLSRSCPESAILWHLRANDLCAASNIVDIMVNEFVQNSGQSRYSNFILEELIGAFKEPPSSLLSLCIAVQIMATRDAEQRLSAAIKFLLRGDIHNKRLDIVIAMEASQILMSLSEEKMIRSGIRPYDIQMLMTLMPDNITTAYQLDRALSQLILQPSTVDPVSSSIPIS